MAISDYSTTAANNATAGSVNFAEGQAPSTVNDSARQVMADIRAWYESVEFRDFGHAVTQTGATTFRITSDVTAIYVAGRRIKCNDSSTLYGYISSSSYSDPNTTVTVTLDSGSLSASLSSVELGLEPTYSGLPRLNNPHLNEAVAVTATATEVNTLDGITATTAELNILDGVTSTTAELNILDGVTATAAELNALDGITATVTELNYTDGVTSNIQTQLNDLLGYTTTGTTGSLTTGTGTTVTLTHSLGTDDVLVELTAVGSDASSGNYEDWQAAYMTPDKYTGIFRGSAGGTNSWSSTAPSTGDVTVWLYNSSAVTQTISYRVRITKRAP